MLAAEARREGVTVDVWRPFSGYGEDQDHCYPFRAFVERARAREDPFEVWGSARSARDWVHIDDVVDVVFDGLGHNTVVNVCTGRATTFAELAAMVCEAAGYSPRVVEVPGPTGVFWRVGDPGTMSRVPIVSIEEGCRRAV